MIGAKQPHYTYVWEFHVAPAAQAQFEREYGPHGFWARLFRGVLGYPSSIEDAAGSRRSNLSPGADRCE